MSHLRPCAGCRRHVRATEAVCPFCAAALEPPGEAPRVPRARLTRAAVFAGAVAIGTTTAACGGGLSKEDTTPTVGGVVIARDVVDDDRDEEIEEHDHDVAMPYGAPPSRDRLV